MIDIKYILIVFIAIVFFIYGLILSEIIDFIFTDHDDNREDYRLALEIIGEIGIAYIIYYSFERYSEIFINSLFNKISRKVPFYMNQLLLISFSYGIFKHLQKSSNKIKYFRKKFLNF
jgi:hypothetical protein